MLTNALKYSPSGSPLTISMRSAGDEIITSVKDAGIGIQPEDEGYIFEKDYRGPVKSPGDWFGAGRRKKDRGGARRMTPESQAVKGSRFQFSLSVFKRDAA